jgi:hypothetical protein
MAGFVAFCLRFGGTLVVTIVTIVGRGELRVDNLLERQEER